MKLRLLPSNTNADGQLQVLTTFIVNDQVAIDAGSIAVALTPEEMAKIRHVIITHTHNDHIASLSIFVAEAYTLLKAPVMVYGTAEVITALQEFVFNNVIFPDFAKINLQGTASGALQYQALEPRQTVEIGGLRVTPIPVNHVVPTCGMIVRDEDATVIFSGDTYVTDELWERASREEKLKAVFVDVSYPNELEWLAEQSGHLTPQSLASDLKKHRGDTPVFAYHIKPTNREKVIAQLHSLGDPRIRVAEIGHLYEF